MWLVFLILFLLVILGICIGEGKILNNCVKQHDYEKLKTELGWIVLIIFVMFILF